MKRTVRRVTVTAHAKVNVGWRVGERRDDGYHDVSGLMQTISLADTLEISTHDGEDGLELSVQGHPELETTSNLVRAAADVLAERVMPLPTRVVLRKNIPVAAGLGGGSADAAGALIGLNAVWGGSLRPRDLVDLATRVGSDVAAICVGGLVHASGRGERVRHVGSFDDGWLVLGVSDAPISAADAYSEFDAAGSSSSDHLHHNDLEDAACRVLPDLRDRVLRMREAMTVAYVSGSGPTVVGVVATEAEATRAAERVRDAFHDVVLARPTDHGVALHVGP